MIIFRTTLAENYSLPQSLQAGGSHAAARTQHALVGNEKGQLVIQIDTSSGAIPVNPSGSSIHADVFQAENAAAALAALTSRAAKSVTIRNVSNKWIRVAMVAAPAEYVTISPNLSEEFHVLADADELSIMRDDASVTPLRVETIIHP